MPLFNEEEYAELMGLYGKGMVAFGNVQKQFAPMAIRYKEMTGEWLFKPHTMFHHRLSYFGPDCENCGKPYRTAEVEFCVDCGHGRFSQEKTPEPPKD